MPGMLRVNVMSALASARPSGSVTVADRVIASGSCDRLIRKADAVRDAVSLPDPRLTVSTASAAFPAGSVPVMVILLVPGASARLSWNVPSAPAVPAIDDPLASFRASSVVRACVLPLMLTALPLTVLLFFGELMVIFGGVASYT